MSGCGVCGYDSCVDGCGLTRLTVVRIAVQAALRGDDTPLPLRGESISIGPLNSFPPRPPVPHHTSSSSSNGRQGSPSLHSTERPPPVGRVSSRGEVAPFLPNRVTSPSTTSPKSRDVPPTPPFHASSLPSQPPKREVPPTPPSHSSFHPKDGPPLPNRGSLRGSRPALPSVPSHGHGGGVRMPVPPVASHPSPGGGGGGGRPTVPPPMNRSGSKPHIPDKPKPTLPYKPAAITRKSPAPAKVGGAGAGGPPASPVSIPSPDDLTPHEMVGFFLSESPAMIAAVRSGSGNIPRMLDELVVLGEAITDQVKGSRVQFRIRITQFRNGLGKLKTFSNITWYNCTSQIVEELEKLVASLEVIQQNMIG